MKPLFFKFNNICNKFRIYIMVKTGKLEAIWMNASLQSLKSKVNNMYGWGIIYLTEKANVISISR